MIVHADDPGHDRETAQVEDRGAVARSLFRAARDGGDLAALDGDVPIRDRRSSRAIDDLDVLENDFRRADAQILAHLRTESIDPLGIGRACVRQWQEIEKSKPAGGRQVCHDQLNHVTAGKLPGSPGEERT